MTDITIPADVAKRYATQPRTFAAAKRGNVTRFEADDLTAAADLLGLADLLDLLDPPPASLRERVRLAIAASPTWDDGVTDALAVIADAVEALDVPLTYGTVDRREGSEAALAAVLDLLRGGGDRG